MNKITGRNFYKHNYYAGFTGNYISYFSYQEHADIVPADPENIVYKDVADNEFFCSDQTSLALIQAFKKAMLEKYS